MGKDKYQQGASVWARSEEYAWVRGHVSSRSGDTVKVKMEKGGTVSVDIRDVEYCSTTPSQEAKVEDMTQLPDLHHPALLATLNERFNKDKIYTYTGPILIALNPFKKLDRLYDSKNMLKYLGSDASSTLAPHAWTLAHKAYKDMIDKGGRNQSVLVSGESGAGKTVSTKIVMNYLTVIASGDYKTAVRKMDKRSSSKRMSSSRSSTVSERVLEANPLMEAFGNAKTLRNDNSSRFGKLIQLQFDERNYGLVGASIDVYLLEKSRVIDQLKGERNYHIFYEMAAGLGSSAKKKLLWPELSDCRYTNASGCYKRADIKDGEQFSFTMRAFNAIGFSSDEQDSVFRMMSAVLHLGNVRFEAHSKDGAEGSRVKKSCKASIEACSELLGVQSEMLADALCTHAVSVGPLGGMAAMLAKASKTLGENFVKQHTPEQAALMRDGLAQTLYERVFSWIVWRINESITEKTSRAASRPKSTKINARKSRAVTSKKKESDYYDDFSIGCLDIFGFEVFDQRNTFEQLLINYTNEQLQNQFNEFVFELEQQEYESEGIDWTVIDFPDNTRCLEMFEDKTGLFALVDEECLFPQGDDRSLANKLYQNMPRQYKNHFLVHGSLKRDFQFAVNHFAGEVVYDVESFCRKNRNELRQEAVNLMRVSDVKLFRILLPENAAQASGGSDAGEYFSSLKPNDYRSSLVRHKRTSPTTSRLQNKTVSALFKAQLHTAMNHIRASEPHYIRCLKSNDKNVSGIFDRPRIEEQLCYSGVLEVVKVARAGYSTRFPLKEFCRRFDCLVNKPGSSSRSSKNKKDTRAVCSKILRNADLVEVDDFQIGHTKIFLKPHAYSSLEILKADALREYAIVLQRAVRAWLVWLRANRKLLEKRAKERAKKEAARKKEQERQRQLEQERERLEAMRKREQEKRQEEQRKQEEREALERKRAEALRRKEIEDRKREERERRERARRKQEEERAVQERAALVLQSMARMIHARDTRNDLFQAQVQNKAVRSLQGFAKMLSARRTVEQKRREMEAEEQRRRLEEEGDGSVDTMILYAAPVALYILLTYPSLVLSIGVGFAAMALGGGLMLEAQESSPRTRRNRKKNKKSARQQQQHFSDDESADDDDDQYQDDYEDYHHNDDDDEEGDDNDFDAYSDSEPEQEYTPPPPRRTKSKKSNAMKKSPSRADDLAFFNAHSKSSSKLTRSLSSKKSRKTPQEIY